jgi:hypothetical protein
MESEHAIISLFEMKHQKKKISGVKNPNENKNVINQDYIEKMRHCQLYKLPQSDLSQYAVLLTEVPINLKKSGNKIFLLMFGTLNPISIEERTHIVF